RRVACLPRVVDPRDDDAAPALRLLLANAPAGARARLRRERRADRLSRSPGQGRRDFRARSQALIGSRTMRIAAIVAALVLSAAAAQAQQPQVDPAKADAAIKAAFPTAPTDWAPRLVPDQAMRECSAHRNNAPKAVAEEIQKREKATIEYPADGN